MVSGPVSLMDNPRYPSSASQKCRMVVAHASFVNAFVNAGLTGFVSNILNNASMGYMFRFPLIGSRPVRRENERTLDDVGLALLRCLQSARG